MSTFRKTDLQRFAISAIGAVLVSATCVVGAVGQAKAATGHAVSTAFLTGGVSQPAAR